MVRPRAVALVLVVFAAASAAESLYDVLGVSSSATPAEIRTAYRKLALELHPDKRGGSGWADTTERFIKVSEAYATLSNARKRERYDAAQQRQQWWRPQPSRGSSGGSEGGGRGGGSGFQFTFSLADALDVLEKHLRSQPALRPLVASYAVARKALERWPGFRMPLPQLLASGALLASAVDLVDWSAIGSHAKKALARSFEHEDGSVDWGRVAVATGAGVTALAAALDATDEGNRTQQLLSWGGKLLGVVQRAAQEPGAAKGSCKMMVESNGETS